MPRSNRPRRRGRPAASPASGPAPDDGTPGRGVERVEAHPDGDWVVRSVTGAAATKDYRCPGCDHEIRPATPHVVAWPEGETGLEHRRHWHTACWNARGRRGPTVRRPGGAPRY